MYSDSLPQYSVHGLAAVLPPLRGQSRAQLLAGLKAQLNAREEPLFRR